ncbi:putative xaa-His dipeptidase [Clostridium sporogenes]|uniref:Putative xaa-His dipeptidase n=1 Tax=Clostridium sporogenes TaxID=1509 RepID=A0A1L3NGV3_CLOSG|nr:Xaa-His dipeptidase [Clostridium sporogenes]APH15337.1 putative xaa-His dipeptidase [Clostridium sporogenes]
MARSDSFEDIIEKHLDEIEQWVEQNNTDKEIAEKLGIAYSTFRKYKSNNVALKSRIATAKDKKNQEVEKALYKCCIGYHYYEEVVTKVKTEDVVDGQIITNEDVIISKVKKYKGPELNAEKYWLNNKEKAKWKEDPHRAANDKKVTKMKEKEVELKVKMMEGLEE